MLVRVGKSLLGSMRLLLFAALLGASSMLISFLVVHYFARDLVSEKAVDPTVLRRANLFRDFNNELAVLCTSYARRVPADPAQMPNVSRDWVEKVARPEFQFLQRRIDEAFQVKSTESVQLEATTARCSAMARRPTDKTLRAAALGEAASTIAMIEKWISAQGIENRLSRPAAVVRFP